ncbi:MAG: DUF4062 domain-containing protein [Candidatus Binataceae bacterium]
MFVQTYLFIEYRAGLDYLAAQDRSHRVCDSRGNAVRQAGMAQTATRPNVPVFVSSTFTDMQVYRRKIQDALTQLEAVVRGMEQFGSKPGSPVEECLKVVQSCQLYVGVFGMRYGSVPDGYSKSMTHLEYDEAQRLNLPSLIYILNEDHPIPPKDVEIGAGAEKLKELKEQLKKRHTVSFFTTPEDLQARVMHDVPAHLEEMGVEIADGLAKAEETGDLDVLKKFAILPKIFSGRQITIGFSFAGNLQTASTEDCVALHLEPGATVACYVTIDSGQRFYIYGERDIALELLSLPKNSKVKAIANTAFGTHTEVLWFDDPIPETRTEMGLVITQILNTEPAKI